MKFLVEHGADISAKTSNGGTPLWWAKKMHDTEHDVVKYLIGIGAPDDGEDL
jgi:ankyrin repeat protein